MPQIVTKAYFSKGNGLDLPLAVANPTPTGGQVTPNNTTKVDSLCVRIEKDLLIKALGLTAYNELQTALADIENVANAKWKKLLNGEEYNGKYWKGLKDDLGFIAQRIYATFLIENNDQLTALGTAKAKQKNSKMSSPDYRISRANNSFLKGYQGGYLFEPIIVGDFIDWYGQEEAEVSLWQYLIDKKADFTTWDENKYFVFGLNETYNSFGL